jgi:type IX secretion system PorP/SprF family membrane protein
MKNFRNIVLYIFIFCHSFLIGQDIHLTQFYANPVYLNPAFTGASGCLRVAGVYRNQWPAISNGYVSYVFSADGYIPEAKSGLGLVLSNDVAGSGQLRTTNAMASYAYETNINRAYAIRAGIQVGMGSKSVNINNLLFGDQISRGGSVSTIENIPQSVYYFDSNAGLLFYGKKFWVGFSAFHLNRPNESLTGNTDAKLPVKYSAHGGVKILLDGEEKGDRTMNTYITPVLHYYHQEKFDQLDVGCYFTKAMINVGFWYRGIPGLKAYKPGYSNNDAFAVLIGCSNDKFNVGYSYDFTISKLSGNTKGGHEISLSFQYCKKKKKKRVLISCPKF